MSTPAAEPVQDPTVATPQNKSWFSTVDWLARHEALLHAARERGGRCELVFLGDSITEGWLTDGKDVWNDAYAQYKPVNLGIGGDEVQHLMWRVQHGEVEPLTKARCAVILIGTNNLGNVGHRAGAVAAGAALLIGELKRRLPETNLLLLGVFPRDAEPGTPLRTEVLELNRQLQLLRDGERVFFLDIGEYFTDYRQRVDAETMPDFLHLSAAGYEIWRSNMQLTLRRLLHGRKGRQTKVVRKSTGANSPDIVLNLARPKL